MTRLLIALIPLVLSGCPLLSTGCQGPAAFPREMADGFRAVTTSIADQAQWKAIIGNVRGHVNNPGFVGYVAVKYEAGGRLEGVDGDVSLSGQGTGSGVTTPEAREAMIETLRKNPQLLERIVDLIRENSNQPEPPAPPGP